MAGPSSTTFTLPTATGTQALHRCPACGFPFSSFYSAYHPILLPNCGCIYHASCLARFFALQLAFPPHHCLCPTCSIDGMVTHAFIHPAPDSTTDQIHLEATLHVELGVLILRVTFPPAPLPAQPEVEPFTPAPDLPEAAPDLPEPPAEQQVPDFGRLTFRPAPGSRGPQPAAATSFALPVHPARMEWDAERRGEE
ncbi:hypothetical protein NpPPO83_00007633 [Neofusicoccum parvum]|uniref:Uncharacterized protein n=1 Tax=Neofusicoccum parvum TaxID=310453 RepID=A0ACB5S9P9_9PEZI|nr:hypothetical protein NpPPO83_00007633 [Neofusicoccum parvum]